MAALLGTVLPIFGLILAGYVCGRRQSFGAAATGSLNAFVVTLALPALLFLGAAHVTRATAGPPAFLWSFSAAMLICFLLSFGLERLAGHDIADCAIAGLGGGYANTGFIGIPLCVATFGEGGLQPALMSSLLTISGLFALALAFIEFDRQSAGGIGPTLLRTARGLLRSPLVVAPLAGFALDWSGLALPVALDRFATLLGEAASPCALVTIGLFLADQRGADQRGADQSGADQSRPAQRRPPFTVIARLVAIKLLLQPALTGVIVWRFTALPPLWRDSAVLIAALPTGTGPFMLAKLYDREAASMSGTILISTMLSLLSISLLVAWLRPA